MLKELVLNILRQLDDVTTAALVCKAAYSDTIIRKRLFRYKRHTTIHSIPQRECNWHVTLIDVSTDKVFIFEDPYRYRMAAWPFILRYIGGYLLFMSKDCSEILISTQSKRFVYEVLGVQIQYNTRNILERLGNYIFGRDPHIQIKVKIHDTY